MLKHTLNRRLAQPTGGDPSQFSLNARGTSGDGLLAGGAVPLSSQRWDNPGFELLGPFSEFPPEPFRKEGQFLGEALDLLKSKFSEAISGVVQTSSPSSSSIDPSLADPGSNSQVTSEMQTSFLDSTDLSGCILPSSRVNFWLGYILTAVIRVRTAWTNSSLPGAVVYRLVSGN